ncbi:sugar ABC transporter ATP-binding protein [Vallitalea guaymasensis]|uniref:sugar ABC transporter ATP-binding protein n=1 Tax=Vallitalea guaymasensis TaxID=1185412 RepID=UPI000DE2516F|nr:sugar ABC transporter ATP-binding protein [Vallitalea guaymasensis]
MSELFLEMKQVSKTYGGVKALKNVKFELNKGEIHCLVGQNGSGKSTLIKIIAGVLKPDKNSIVHIFDGDKGLEVTDRNAQNKVSVIYQDLSVFPNMTVAENIAINSYADKAIGHINWKEIYKKAEKALEKIQVELDLSTPVSELSIADRQLVAIARAIATDAELVIMDEPTSSLTRKEVNILFGIIRDLQEKGMTIMFVSHRLDEILEIAERITALRDGEIVGVFDSKDIDDTKLGYLISEQNIIPEQKFNMPDYNTILLEVKNLYRVGHYKDISFRLSKGEVLGIIGLLGSGRTELALSLFGMNTPTSGEIYIEGKEVKLKTNKCAIKNKIAYVPEDRLLQGLVIDQSVKHNMSLTIIEKLQEKFGLINKKRQVNITNDYIEKLSIKSATPNIHASAMSGGNQQKIVIAKWLAIEPNVLILDEPTNGIDIGAKSVIYDIIRTLAESGMGIIIISDEVPEIYYNCSRCLIMNKGSIVKEVNTMEITEKEFYNDVLQTQ